MANSLNARFLLTCFALVLGAGGVAQEADTPGEPLVFEFESLSADRTSNTVQWLRPKIMQGSLTIEADEASGDSTDFTERGEWRFTGNVRITAGTAVLEATSAVFTFDDGRLSRGELTGTPVTFSDVDNVRQTQVEGRAQQVSYDYVARTLRMTGDASVQRGRTQVLGCDLVYDFAAVERDAGFWITNGPDDCAEPLRFLIEPNRDDQPDAADAPQ